jgi:hypothetical protein
MGLVYPPGIGTAAYSVSPGAAATCCGGGGDGECEGAANSNSS